jgi:phage-related protein
MHMMAEMKKPTMKLVKWMGSSLKDLKKFPEDVQHNIGYAIEWAQHGDKHSSAKALKGFGGASVLEVIEDHDGDTYRAVYTVEIAEIIVVLHCFQKKSKKGRSTPKAEMDLIRKRLNEARALYGKNN